MAHASMTMRLPAMVRTLWTRLPQSCTRLPRNTLYTLHTRLHHTRSFSSFLGMPLVNTLANASSPYLRAHSDNPVAWQQWTDATLQRAQDENKPIFLSIGYHTCHWCHVMNDESFTSPTIAAILNESYIPIKLDREDRPDIDSVYMLYLQAISGGRGGWPLNVFLAPGTLEPIFGGTYWPGPWEEVSVKTGRESRPAGPEFRDVLLRIHQYWTSDENKCRTAGSEAVRQLRLWTDADNASDSGRLLPDAITDARQYFVDRYDRHNGGFGDAPKFPQPTVLSFLIRQNYLTDFAGQTDRSNSSNIADMATSTLGHIAKGGIHDLIGNGFARYSVTADWSLPHFEKMLYDQAMLLNAYVDAYLYSPTPSSLDCIHDIATYLTDGPLTHPAAESGAFYSAEDADSMASDVFAREGAFYVWTYSEFFDVLGRIPGDIAAAHWNVSEYGNVDAKHDPHHDLQGQNVLAVTMDVPELSSVFGMPEQAIRDLLDDCRQKLRAHREKTRARPSLDTKIIASWNGLAISALTRAAAITNSSEWLESAKAAAQFIKSHMYDADSHELSRVYFDGKSSTPGMCDDYANLIAGLIDLYEATLDIEYLIWARDLQDAQIRLLYDSASGGFFSSVATNSLIFRLKTGADTVEPSSNAVSVSNLLRLAAILDNVDYSDKAVKTIDSFTKDIAAQPYAYCSMLPSVVARYTGMRTIVVVARESNDTLSQMLSAIRKILLPNTTVVVLRKPQDEHEQRLQDWLVSQNELYATLISNSTAPVTAYVCQHNSCSAPVTNVDELTAMITVAPERIEPEQQEPTPESDNIGHFPAARRSRP